MPILNETDIQTLQQAFLSNPTINANKKYRILSLKGTVSKDNLLLINVTGKDGIYNLTFYPITDEILQDPDAFIEGDNYDEDQEYLVTFNANSDFNETIEEVEEPTFLKGGKKSRIAWKGWKRQNPKTKKERTQMWKKCGKKCFLGTKKSYPICTRKTCKINKKGVYSAYIRSRQFKKKNISKKAIKILKK